VDLRSNIEQDLWEAIEQNYKNESYASSILDAMHLLTDTIRNKTGLEGDGSSLIGQAFGGDNPKLQLNKLQTESEKNVQKGTQELLRGLYTAIRNPRSHEKYKDTKDDADSIIHFIGYLLKVIDKSKTSFQPSTFLQRVYDQNYVHTEQYSKLLVNEVPKRQRINIAISIILEQQNVHLENVRYFLRALFDKLEDNEISEVYKVISEQLKYTHENEDIITMLYTVPGEYWGKLDKSVKIRMEHILYKSVEIGRYIASVDSCREGALGTWIESEHLMNFENISEWMSMMIIELKYGEDEERIAYIEKFFWDKICKVNYDNVDYWLLDYIKEGLNNRDEEIVNKLKSEIQFTENHSWWKTFEKELRAFPEIQYQEPPF
jgi:uncharacterized protein (TIGR02391 family)